MWKSNGLNNTCRKRINDTSRKHKQANGKHPERKCACDADRKMRAGVKMMIIQAENYWKAKNSGKIGENGTLLSREHLSNRWKLIPLIPHQDPTTKGGGVGNFQHLVGKTSSVHTPTIFECRRHGECFDKHELCRHSASMFWKFFIFNFKSDTQKDIFMF